MSSGTTTVAIIGGSGLYSMRGLTGAREERVATPFGEPSDSITVGTLGRVRMLFLARHGRHHSFAPHEVNYRANIWALKQLGATWCLGVSAVGSLQEHLRPGELVVPDQLIDRTVGRKGTFFEQGIVAHVSFSQPYCPLLRSLLLHAGSNITATGGTAIHDGGTLVCMDGPAFSTVAESELHRSWNADLIGMTGCPEAKLAREAELGYASLACVTDYDCWRAGEEAVTVSMVIETQRRNIERAALIIEALMPLLEDREPPPEIRTALEHAVVTAPDAISNATRERLAPLLARVMAPRA